jgi:hypothetical protein
MKKRPDLKQRLDDLRGEPEQPVEITLRLDAEQYRELQVLALAQNLSVAAYLDWLIGQHLNQVESDTET